MEPLFFLSLSFYLSIYLSFYSCIYLSSNYLCVCLSISFSLSLPLSPQAVSKAPRILNRVPHPSTHTCVPHCLLPTTLLSVHREPKTEEPSAIVLKRSPPRRECSFPTPSKHRGPEQKTTEMGKQGPPQTLSGVGCLRLSPEQCKESELLFFHLVHP